MNRYTTAKYLLTNLRQILLEVIQETNIKPNTVWREADIVPSVLYNYLAGRTDIRISTALKLVTWLEQTELDKSRSDLVHSVNDRSEKVDKSETGAYQATEAKHSTRATETYTY